MKQKITMLNNLLNRTKEIQAPHNSSSNHTITSNTYIYIFHFLIRKKYKNIKSRRNGVSLISSFYFVFVFLLVFILLYNTTLLPPTQTFNPVLSQYDILYHCLGSPHRHYRHHVIIRPIDTRDCPTNEIMHLNKTSLSVYICYVHVLLIFTQILFFAIGSSICTYINIL